MSKKAYALRKPKARSRIGNGSAIMAGVDGRSRRARLVHDVFTELVSDQGGPERMSQARKDLTMGFAVSAALVREAGEAFCKQEPIDFDQFNQMLSNMVRVGARIGINRVAKDVTPLREYMRTKRTEPSGRISSKSERAT